MMPEMDGFTVLDELKKKPETEKIPVVVITAKELSASEKKVLARQTSRLMSKGDFLSDDLIEEIDKVIG